MLLSLEGVSKRFERTSGTKVAVDDLSLELERGKIVGLHGPSGAGKTTLLQIAAGLLTPDDGEVFYDGRRLDQLPRGEWKRLHRQEIACIWSPTQSAQAGLEVLEHVEMPLLLDRHDHRGAARRAREALAACEADGCAGMMLNELSDGERQRVAIARAIVIEPRLLLADGPARGLSFIEQERIMVLLQALAHEARVAVLVTDSEANALIRAHPILYMNGGKLVNAPTAAKEDNVYELPRRSRQAAADA
jgi:putative ABC transport system ATP-binding protein